MSGARRFSELEHLALVIAITVPSTKHLGGRCAYVPYSHIAKIRAELERLGVDWRRLKAECDADRKARQAAAS